MIVKEVITDVKQKYNDFGKAVCRFRVYQQCEETFFEQISRLHSKALELLCQIILVKPKLMKNVESINHHTN